MPAIQVLPSQNASAINPSVTLWEKKQVPLIKVLPSEKKRVPLIKVLPSKNISATHPSIAGLTVYFNDHWSFNFKFEWPCRLFGLVITSVDCIFEPQLHGERIKASQISCNPIYLNNINYSPWQRAEVPIGFSRQCTRVFCPNLQFQAHTHILLGFILV